MPRVPDTSPQTLRVFAALLGDPTSWRYGYDLSRETGLASGTLYPILIRLAERELVETRWEPPAQPGRPARHTYRLTTDGAAFAAQRLADAKPAPRRVLPADAKPVPRRVLPAEATPALRRVLRADPRGATS